VRTGLGRRLAPQIPNEGGAAKVYVQAMIMRSRLLPMAVLFAACCAPSTTPPPAPPPDPSPGAAATSSGSVVGVLAELGGNRPSGAGALGDTPPGLGGSSAPSAAPSRPGPAPAAASAPAAAPSAASTPPAARAVPFVGDADPPGGEAAYRQLDAAASKQLGAVAFEGDFVQVKSAFEQCVKQAIEHGGKMQALVAERPRSPLQATVLARRSTLLDLCRRALLDAKEPALRLFTDKEAKLLEDLRRLCKGKAMPDACVKADSFAAVRRSQWAERAAELAGETARVEAALAARALSLGKALTMAPPALTAVATVFAELARDVGDEKMRAILAEETDPATGVRFAYRPGMFSAPKGP
jgi:hypothetical protein